MKLLHIFLLVTVLFLTGCVTSGSRTTSNNARPDNAITSDNDIYMTLADYLRKVPGVSISGTRGNEVVIIRGASSILLNNEPIFIIDGRIAADRYADANAMVNVWDIDYVRVLKGTEAGIYGSRGANGAIVIVTKK